MADSTSPPAPGSRFWTCGGLGIRVENSEDVEGALRDALAHRGPSLVEIITDPLLV